MRKCPYCDFNSHEQKTDLPQREYIEALIKDIESELPDVWGRKIVSVFMGGGTPSLFDPEYIAQLISALRARLNLTSDTEITLEANPGTVDFEKFSEFRDAGINRLSIGIQSFDNDLLRRLGRIHDRTQAFRATEAAHAAGFDNFNLDLMFGLPTQTAKHAQSDVRNAIDLAPAHISYYELTLEPNTLFHAQPPTLPNENTLQQIQDSGMKLLAEQGYKRYEISAYAKDGSQCLHNMNYWQFGDYLGIGAGAHGKITNIPQQTITRHAKVKHPREYLASRTVMEQRTLSEQDAITEFMMNALRLTNGVNTRLFTERTGLPLSSIETQLEQAQEKGLLEPDDLHIRPTQKGLLYLNDLLALF